MLIATGISAVESLIGLFGYKEEIVRFSPQIEPLLPTIGYFLAGIFILLLVWQPTYHIYNARKKYKETEKRKINILINRRKKKLLEGIKKAKLLDIYNQLNETSSQDRKTKEEIKLGWASIMALGFEIEKDDNKIIRLKNWNSVESLEVYVNEFGVDSAIQEEKRRRETHTNPS